LKKLGFIKATLNLLKLIFPFCRKCKHVFYDVIIDLKYSRCLSSQVNSAGFGIISDKGRKCKQSGILPLYKTINYNYMY
jgi:hypothetical protein